MTQSTTAAVWTYYWQVPSNISSGTTLNVTATATDTNNLPYSGNASLTLTVSRVSPKASLSLSDNNIGVSSVVTITAFFNKSMTPTPTLSISGGLLSNVAFTSYTTENSQIGVDIDGEAQGNGFGGA